MNYLQLSGRYMPQEAVESEVSLPKPVGNSVQSQKKRLEIKPHLARRLADAAEVRANPMMKGAPFVLPKGMDVYQHPSSMGMLGLQDRKKFQDSIKETITSKEAIAYRLTPIIRKVTPEEVFTKGSGGITEHTRPNWNGILPTTVLECIDVPKLTEVIKENLVSITDSLSPLAKSTSTSKWKPPTAYLRADGEVVPVVMTGSGGGGGGGGENSALGPYGVSVSSERGKIHELQSVQDGKWQVVPPGIQLNAYDLVLVKNDFLRGLFVVTGTRQGLSDAEFSVMRICDPLP